MRAENAETVNCPSCGAALIGGLRFCRMCGYRLGEGVDEYVPTQRLDPSAATAAPPRPATDPFAARQTWGASPMQPVRPFGAVGEQPGATSSLLSKACSKSRGGMWWLWMVVVLVIVLGVGGGVAKKMRGGANGGVVVTKSFLGVDSLEDAEGGGALITGIAAPDTPVVRAGLIGGDIIKSFDGKPVRDADELREVLEATPAGKTVEVIYVRDGVEAKTTLTTIAAKDNPGLKVFDRRPGGAGNIGIDRRDLERVSVPGTNLFGAEVGDIDRNGPADMAGLRKGDVVIQFGDFPIRTAGDLRYRISEALPGSVAKVIVMRGGERVEITVPVGRSRD
jgi:hypothetical protein